MSSVSVYSEDTFWYTGYILPIFFFCISGLLEKPIPPPHIAVAEATYKILFIGKSGVGKTSTIAKLAGNQVPITHCETQGNLRIGLHL